MKDSPKRSLDQHRTTPEVIDLNVDCEKDKVSSPACTLEVVPETKKELTMNGSVPFNSRQCVAGHSDIASPVGGPNKDIPSVPFINATKVHGHLSAANQAVPSHSTECAMSHIFQRGLAIDYPTTEEEQGQVKDVHLPLSSTPATESNVRHS